MPERESPQGSLFSRDIGTRANQISTESALEPEKVEEPEDPDVKEVSREIGQRALTPEDPSDTEA